MLLLSSSAGGLLITFVCLFVFGATASSGPRTSSYTRFLDHTQRRTTVDRAPLDEGSARRRDLYFTTHNTHSRQTSMPPVGFKPKRPQNYAIERAATGAGMELVSYLIRWGNLSD